MCQSGKITGISADGGWAEYLLTPAEALASIPDELSADEAAPLLCAGITTFNSLRRSGARAGDLVAIHGIGGLGHLGIQFAAKLGFNTVAIGRGKDKEHLARKLGASQYIGSSSARQRARRSPRCLEQVAWEKATGVAKEGSPISRLLDTTITMEAKLEG